MTKLLQLKFFKKFERKAKFVLQYKPPDHHVKTISVDLSNCKKNNNEIMVKPNLVLEDTGKKTKPGIMSLKVVIIATVGDGNPNIHMIDILKINEETNLPNNLSTVRSALYSTFVQFPNVDHHLQKYSSIIVPYIKESTFSLNGQTMIYDKASASCGKVQGSVIIYNKDEKHILCEDFRPDNIQIGCFIHGYELSFEPLEDHHVLKIEVSVDVENSTLFVKDGSISHNYVSGFIGAFNSKL